MINRKTGSAFLIALLVTTSCIAQLNVQDGFEGSELSKIWSTDRMVKDAFQIQSVVLRSGHSAAKITLNKGDVHENGIGKSLGSERDELRENNKLLSAEGKTYEYAFSLFLPDSFPIVPTRLVIAQWKQKCPDNDLCSDDSPVIAVRYESGRLSITIQTDSGKKTVYKTTKEVRNTWLDFTFRIHFSRSDSGRVTAWLNKKQVVDFKGATGYTSAKGYTDTSSFYFKMGLYRDVMNEPMTIYIDDYSKKELIK